MSLKLMYITNDVNEAKIAENAGVDRIFIDIERVGKEERQRNLNTFISDHKITDVGIIKKCISSIEVMLRINPFHEQYSQKEIDMAIEQGVDIIMLPMFTSKREVEQFIKSVNGRCKTCLLMETAQSLVRIDEILEVEGIDEVHIGLNDMSISLKLDFMFEVLAGGIVEFIGEKLIRKNIKWGFGGIGKVGEGILPSQMIIGEHIRLNSNMVILSRHFRDSLEALETEDKMYISLKEEIYKIRKTEEMWRSKTKDKLEMNYNEVKWRVREIASSNN